MEKTPRTPTVGSAWPEFFSTCQKKGWRWPGIGNEGGAYQLQCAILAVPPRPCNLSSNPTLGSAVASSSHCQPIGPKSDPWRTLPKCTRAKSEPIINGQTRSNTIETVLFAAMAHSHDCRSIFISCSFNHCREDCPLRVHICSPFPDGFFEERQHVSCAFLRRSLSSLLAEDLCPPNRCI